jgi:hypothetical protein
MSAAFDELVVQERDAHSKL